MMAMMPTTASTTPIVLPAVAADPAGSAVSAAALVPMGMTTGSANVVPAAGNAAAPAGGTSPAGIVAPAGMIIAVLVTPPAARVVALVPAYAVAIAALAVCPPGTMASVPSPALTPANNDDP